MTVHLIGRQETVDRFVVRDFLGRGAIGDVLLAWDPREERLVALKVVRPAKTDPEMLEAEKSGVSLQAQLAAAAPQVAAVYEQGQDGDFFWVAMEYVAGTDLSEVLARGALPEARAVRIAIELVSMLEVCHQFSAEVGGRRIFGIVHGDIKPENIRLQEDDRVRVLDFGIAKHLSQTRRFTVNLFGSLPYTPPERLERGVVDRHSDLWAVGVVLATMVSGRRPFPGGTPEELEQAIRHGVPPLPLPAGCSPELSRVVDRSLAFEVGRRYQSAAELAADLAALRDGRPLPGPAAAAAAADLHATRRTARPLSGEEIRTAEATRRTGGGPLRLAAEPASEATRRTAPAGEAGEGVAVAGGAGAAGAAAAGAGAAGSVAAGAGAGAYGAATAGMGAAGAGVGAAEAAVAGAAVAGAEAAGAATAGALAAAVAEAGAPATTGAAAAGAAAAGAGAGGTGAADTAPVGAGTAGTGAASAAATGTGPAGGAGMATATPPAAMAPPAWAPTWATAVLAGKAATAPRDLSLGGGVTAPSAAVTSAPAAWATGPPSPVPVAVPAPTPPMPAAQPRHRLRRAALLLAAAALLAFGASQLWAWNQAQQLRRDLAEAHPDLDALVERYEAAAGWSWLSTDLFGVGDELQRSLTAAAARILDSYHGDDPTTTPRGWETAYRYLHGAARMAPRDPGIRARMLYARAHLDRLESLALRGQGNRKQALAMTKEAVAGFQEASRLDPAWPDPYLGLARIYAYDMFDLDALQKTVDELTRRGYQLGRREQAMLADGYRMRGLTFETRAQHSRGSAAEIDLLKQARDDLEQAVHRYADIPGFAFAASNREEAESHLEAITARLSRVHPPSFWERLGRALSQEFRKPGGG